MAKPISFTKRDLGKEKTRKAFKQNSKKKEEKKK